MRYPSPTALQNPLSMLQPPLLLDNPHENGFVPQDDTDARRELAGDSVPQKAFPCSTCGREFRRRSDLAGHGKL